MLSSDNDSTTQQSPASFKKRKAIYIFTVYILYVYIAQSKEMSNPFDLRNTESNKLKKMGYQHVSLAVYINTTHNSNSWLLKLAQNQTLLHVNAKWDA